MSNLKVSINSWLYGDQPTEKAIERLSRIGYDGVEIPVYLQDCNKKRSMEVKQALKKNDVEAATVFCAELAKNPFEFNLNSPDESVRAKAVNYVKNCMDFAKEVEAGVVIIATSPLEVEDPREKLLEYGIDSFKLCSDYASSAGVTVALEQFANRLVDHTDAMIATIRRVNSRTFRGLLDTGHLNILKEDLATSIRKTQKLLAHIHFNNNDGVNDNHRPLTEGTLRKADFANALKALRDIGYEGYYSFEIFNVADPDKVAQESKGYLENLIKTM